MSATARIEEVGLGFDVIVETDQDGTHTRQVLHLPDRSTAATLAIRLTDVVVEDSKRSS